MTTRARLVALASIVSASALAAAALSPAAEAAGQSLQGTVSWTTTVKTDRDVAGGDATTGTETRTVTMKVKMTRRAGAAYWQVEDNGSNYAGTYTLASQRLERDFDGGVNCTVTHAGTGSGSGPLPKKPTSTKAPAMFSNITPGTSSLNSKTKTIVLTPILRYEGTDTTTYTGSGLSPCQGGQEVDPIDGSLAPSDDASQICFPKGASAKNSGANANSVVGAWNNAKKAFVFTCSRTWDRGEGVSVTTTVTGTLKLK